MSTRDLEVLDVDAHAAPHPSASMALVPLPRPAVPPAQAEPNDAHRWFYGSGYTGLALILCAAWVGPASQPWSAALLAMGGLAVGVGGLGVLIHAFFRPRMDRLRKGLGAVAAVALTAAAVLPVHDAALEVHASSRIASLRPLAERVAGTGGVRQIGLPSAGLVELNGFRGDIRSSAPVLTPDGPALNLAQVLARDGISRLALVRLTAAMEAADVLRVEAGAAYIAFDRAGDADLLYVRPGHPLPQPGTAIMDRVRWRTRPLGDGWDLLAG